MSEDDHVQDPAHPSRRQLLKAASLVGTALLSGSASSQVATPSVQFKNAAGLTATPLTSVRVGIIGVGNRGATHVTLLLGIEGVEVKAICDPNASAAQAAAKQCTDAGRPAPALYAKSATDYRRMVERDDLDAVFICTPWDLHVPMAVAAMKAGKHAFIEVPAATTIDGCWELVETAEQTRRHCMMLENVCYGREELLVLNMCRQQVFGELLHGEGAYLHDLRWQMKDKIGTGTWRTRQYTRRNGNLYPTHGLGPLAQYMNINRGDRMDFLCSVSSLARMRTLYAQEQLPAESPHRGLKFVAGDVNTTIIKTVRGRTLMIQWDEQTPRPYSRLNQIVGTRGAWGGFPNRIAVEGRTAPHEWTQGSELDPWFAQYEHPLWQRLSAVASGTVGHGGMDFIMLWRIIYCLRNGLPLDQDVYDAAAWSVIFPLSEASVARRGTSVDIPDFTRGAWATMRPLDIVR